jgi:hypothetical protein
MAKHVIYNASVVVNGVDLSDHVESISGVEIGINNQAAAAMGEVQDYDMPGTQNLGDPVLTFYQDYAASKVYATFFPLFQNRTVFNLVIKADAGANATTNPAFTIPVFVMKKPLLSGKRGDRHMAPVTLKVAGAMTVATS